MDLMFHPPDENQFLQRVHKKSSVIDFCKKSLTGTELKTGSPAWNDFSLEELKED